MGVVYKARDTKLGRLVALKFLPPQWSHDDSAKQRFVREAQAASATNQRNICVIHNIEEMRDGRLFIVMAYYEGETLKQKLERGALPINEAVEIASEIADGLAKAHAQGVIHRDVKPGNLIVTEDGVKILDFGLAKFADALQLTVPGSTIGTIAYMSPEQARGEEADARSDVWALGIVMYEMLTGSVPFRGTYQEATFHAIKNEPLPSLRAARPDVPEALERLVMKALEKDPEKRFQSAREPARDLKLLQGRTVPVDLLTMEVPRPSGVGVKSLPKQRRTRRAVSPARAALVAGLLAAIVAGWYYWSTRPIERVRVAVVPVANHSGNLDLDAYRLGLTSTLIDELSESPNIRVVSYLRLVEMIRPFMSSNGDVSSNDAIRAIATESGVPYLVVPTLNYRDRDATWLVQVQIRNAETGTTISSYETAPITSSLLQQTAFRLVVAAADQVQQHFKKNGPGRSFQPRPASGRFREADAARWFTEGLNKYDQLEYGGALDAFSRSASLDDQHALTYAWLSRVNLILTRKNEAVAAAQRAKALLTADLSPLVARYVEAVLAESQGDLQAAEQSYREIVRTEPDEPYWQIQLSDFLKRREDRNEAAIDAYHTALRLDATYTRPHIDLCQLYARVADHPLAQKEARLALERYKARNMPSEQAQSLLCLGESERVQGGAHLSDAKQHVEAARTLITNLDQPYNLARALYYRGGVEYTAGELGEATRWFLNSSKQAHTVGNRLIEGMSLMNLAVINYLVGHPTESVALYQQSREVFLSMGVERRVAELDLNRMAIEIDFTGRTEQAIKTLDNATANLEKRGYVDFQLVAKESHADIDRYAGRLSASRQELQQALQITREKQLTNRIAPLTLSLAQTELQDGKYVAARRLLQELITNGNANDEQSNVALGTVLMRMGDFAGARTFLDNALSMIEMHQYSGLLPLVHTALGELSYETGRPDEGRSHLTVAVASWTDPFPNAAVIEAQCMRGLQDVLTGRTTSLGDLERAVERSEQLGRRGLIALCRIDLARANIEIKRFATAQNALEQIPSDTEDRTIGAELRAKTEFWKGIAATGMNQPDSQNIVEAARERMRLIQSELPADLRGPFATRFDIAPILSATDVRSHP